MNTLSRIASIAESTYLDDIITGVPTFKLSTLQIATELEFQLPTNKRLGHLAESIVSELIKASNNFNLLHENIQIIKDKNTLGELDFIIENTDTKQVIHLELAYKFYLFDPSISSEKINNWIGPNRNDSLIEKLNKLKSKQFPLLYHPSTKSKLSTLHIDKISQQLCFLTSLYIPYEFKGDFSPILSKAIKGYYVDFETFKRLDTSEKSYYLPSKKEWGMHPSENKIWNNFTAVEQYIQTCMKEKQAPLCWQKHKGNYKSIFIVWW